MAPSVGLLNWFKNPEKIGRKRGKFIQRGVSEYSSDLKDVINITAQEVMP
jgi:hypothetical protein